MRGGKNDQSMLRAQDDIERAQSEIPSDVFGEDHPLRESLEAAAESASRFNLIKELLTATTLGTS